MTTRENILPKLRGVPNPFPHAFPIEHYLPVATIEDTHQSALKARFIQEAENLSCNVYPIHDNGDIAQILGKIISTDQRVSAWDWDRIPFPGLEHCLEGLGVAVSYPVDPNVRVGISGAAAALAAIGALVLDRRKGCPSCPSLLPPVHIAVITEDQILPNFESWIALQRLDDLHEFHRSRNIVVISGPSRTADIGMELILGMHGPMELHILLMPTHRDTAALTI